MTSIVADPQNALAQGKIKPLVPGAQITPIQPGVNDLRGSQITPQPSAGLQQTQGMAQQAAQKVGGANVTPASQINQQIAPYQQQGQQSFNSAVTAGTQQGQFAGRAAGAVQGTGYQGSYGAAPTIGGFQQISTPQFTQGNVNLPGVTTGPLSGLQDLQYAGDTQGLRGRVGQGIDSLYTSPDRVQLASDAFKLFQERAQPEFDQSVRRLGESAAAFGRKGSGLVNSQLADLGTAYKRSADQEARQLAGEAAGQTMSDRLGRLSATQSGLGQFAGLDENVNTSGNQNRLATFDRNLARDRAVNDLSLEGARFNLGRDEAVNNARFRAEQANNENALSFGREAFDQADTNRRFAFGADEARNNLAFRQADLFRGLGSDALDRGRFDAGLSDQAYDRGDRERNFLTDTEDRSNRLGFDQLGALDRYGQGQYDQERGARDELRGERGYQDDLERDAYDRALKQFMTEEGTYDDDVSQQFNEVDLLNRVGNGYDPTNTLQNEADQYNQSGNDAIGGVGDFLNQLAQDRARKAFAADPANSRPPNLAPRPGELRPDLTGMPRF